MDCHRRNHLATHWLPKWGCVKTGRFSIHTMILPALLPAVATASPSGSSEIVSLVRCCGCACGCACRGCRRCSSACIKRLALVNVGAISTSRYSWTFRDKSCTACRYWAASWALVARQYCQPNNEAMTQNTGVSKNRGGPPKWMVYNGVVPIKMDDLGGPPLFLEEIQTHKNSWKPVAFAQQGTAFPFLSFLAALRSCSISGFGVPTVAVLLQSNTQPSASIFSTAKDL